MRVARPALLLVAYLALAMLVSWPLVLNAEQALMGYPTVDGLDTVMLRGLFAERLWAGDLGGPSAQIYFPTGYALSSLLPNMLDHLSAAPLVRWLPFPLADNLWWWLVMAANGMAGHHLGRQLGGTEGAGFLGGVAWALAEPVLREVNLHHAPQALVPWAPLYLAALLRCVSPDGRWRDAVAAGAFMGLAGLTYWYLALFLALGSVPLGVTQLRRPAALKRIALAAGASLLLVSPALVGLLTGWQQLPLADVSIAPQPLNMREGLLPVPEALRFVVEQSAELSFPALTGPLDRSNRVPIVLLIAAVLGTRASPRAWRWGLWGLAAVGAVMVLGPYLKLGHDPLLIAGQPVPLPGRLLGALHPFLQRLTWPQRWGLLIPLGLAALAARGPRPGLMAGLLVAEMLLLSGNAPIQTTPLPGYAPWRALERADGALLELPLVRSGPDAARVGLNARFHKRPVVNPVLLPPGVDVPQDWATWRDEQPLLQWLQAWETDVTLPPVSDHRGSLRRAGVSAVVLDAHPASSVSEGQITAYQMALQPLLGSPHDHGPLLVWWLDPASTPTPPAPREGRAWRKHQRRALRDSPPPDLNTLIQPMWPQIR